MLDDYQDIALRSTDWSPLDGRAAVTVFNEYIASRDELVETLRPFDVIVAMRERTPFPGSLLKELPNLKLLITTGPVNASFDLPAAHACGVVVCGTRGLLNPTSELAWGLILSLSRNIPQEDQAIREGRWQISVGPELGGRTLGIVGLGALGQRVARVAHAFDMNVLAWSQNLTQARAAKFDATLVSKDELFERSDFITVHLQLSERTRGLVGKHELGLMKPTAFIVNTSRGPIIDEDALIEALEQKSIAGAGLDVFDREPLAVDHPLRRLRNTVLTPHIGYVSTEIYGIFYRDIVEDIVAWLDEEPVRVVE